MAPRVVERARLAREGTGGAPMGGNVLPTAATAPIVSELCCDSRLERISGAGRGGETINGQKLVSVKSPLIVSSVNMAVLVKDKDKEFKEIMNEAKKYNALAKEGNPAQRALRTERSPEVKENPAQRALQTERSPEVKENPAQRALQTERSPEVKVNVKKAVQEEFKGLVDETIYNFYGLTEDEGMINALPDEPEFYEVETTLDTGASAHAANRVDFPGYEVVESPGSKAGQHFGCAGGKSLLNEGQMTVHMVSPLEETAISLCTQVTQVTRPLLSVTKMTEDGKLEVLCRRDKAVVRDLKGKILATFPKKNGLYVCMMKVKNQRYRHNQPFPRPLP